MTDDIETLRRKNARLQVALSEANAAREACAQRAFRLEAEVERLREEIAALKEERRRDMAEICSLREALTYDWDQLQACRESLREHMAEGKRLQIDGDRYRWVCDHASAIDLAADPDNFVQVWVGTDPARVFRGKTLDDAIDEAMKQAALRREEV